MIITNAHHTGSGSQSDEPSVGYCDESYPPLIVQQTICIQAAGGVAAAFCIIQPVIHKRAQRRKQKLTKTYILVNTHTRVKAIFPGLPA